MRTINIVLDLYSAVISLLMIAYLVSRKRRKDQLRRSFILMCVLNFCTILGDLTNWTCEGFGQPWYPAALWSGSLLFWLCSLLSLVAFTYYIIAYLRPRVSVHRAFWHAVLILYTGHAACCLLSLWNGMFFTITMENIYQRGTFFWLSQSIAFVIYGINVAIFIVYRKSLSSADFRILSSYIVLPMLSQAIQMCYYGLALLNTGITLAVLVIFINLQAEQELRIERQEKELAQSRIDIMLSQIKPHFLYNTLTAIRWMCDSDPEQAKESIHDFTLFLRANMDSLSSKAPIPFEQELRHTQAYLKLEQQRSQSRLRVVYEIGVWEFAIPPLTLQPIVENAVRHGAFSREEGGTVLLRTEETEHTYLITVRDDGRGFRAGMANAGQRSHMGIANVRERLKILCGGTLTIESAADRGTTAVITIPKERSIYEVSCGRRRGVRA